MNIPKNEQAIKTAIAEIVVAHTRMDRKRKDNIRLKSKSFEYRLNSQLGNMQIVKEEISFWLTVDGPPDFDYSQFESAVVSASNPAFNRLQIVQVWESEPLGRYYRYYEIKVN